MNELEEFRNDAYENSKIYKEKTKAWHDKHIVRNVFEPSQKVFLFNLILMSGPFIVTHVFPYGSVELLHPEKGHI